MLGFQFRSLSYKSFAHLIGTLLLNQIICTLVWCQVVFQPKLYIAWMQWTHHFSFWGKTWSQRMSSHLSRWWYICIRQWRELAFRPDWNELNWVVALPLIWKVGKEVSWTFLFHIPHRLPEVHWWFGEDLLLCFFLRCFIMRWCACPILLCHKV